MPHLYLDDLTNIEGIILDLKARDYRLLTDKYEFQNVKDIPKGTSSSGKLTITCYDPYISIDLSSISARIYTSAETLKAKGAYAEIIKIIKNRERRVLFYLVKSSPVTLAIVLFISLIALMLTLAGKYHHDNIALLGACGIILSLIFFRITYLLDVKRFSLIEFQNKDFRSSFIKRNKDAIVVGIIVAIITAMFTKLF